MKEKVRPTQQEGTSRREFLVRSAGAAAGATAAGRLSIARGAYAAGNDELRLAVIGCGGRGAGAANDALSSRDPIQLVAMADVFEDRLQRSLLALSEELEVAHRVDVPVERQFVGLEGYKRIMDLDVDVVLLTTPPAFRPLHYAAAIASGKHVFMEKPCCLDGPGYRSIMQTNRLADEKGLKVVVGLQRRHQESYIKGIKRIHEGEVGDIILIRTYFNMPGSGPNYETRPSEIPEMEWQIRRWGRFTWLSGDHIVEQAVHEIDVANWIMKDETPVKANGLGGRQVRIGCGNGQIFDHHFVEYVYEDGTRHYAQAKQQPGGWTQVSDNVHGTKGNMTVGFGPYGMGGPSNYEGGEARAEEAEEAGMKANPYQQEHQDLFDAIRNDTVLNDGYHGAKSSMTAVLGRMATYSGDEVTWEEATQSELELAPGLAEYSMASIPPVVPDAEGNYPVAIPGQTKAW